MIIKTLMLTAVLSLTLLSAACSGETEKMQDGYYTAEMADFDNQGWIEFVTIYVNSNKIVTVEYNARNAGGFIKTWDLDYMRKMNAACGTYPSQYTRAYAVSLLSGQDPKTVDALSGATHSYMTFRLLTEAAMQQARAGNKQVAFVTLPTISAQ